MSLGQALSLLFYNILHYSAQLFVNPFDTLGHYEYILQFIAQVMDLKALKGVDPDAGITD